MDAELGEERLAFVVPAAEFGSMGWVLRQLGPRAIIYRRATVRGRFLKGSAVASVTANRLYSIQPTHSRVRQ
jgi:hypothetical protein